MIIRSWDDYKIIRWSYDDHDFAGKIITRWSWKNHTLNAKGFENA
jgi:hypothetical protein